MVGVLKIEKVSYDATNEDVKALFCDFGVCPEDIHWLKNEQGRTAKSAFLAFRTNKEIDQSLKVDGSFFLGQRVSVFPSSPLEFNKFFPSKPLFSRDIGRTQKNNYRSHNLRNDSLSISNRFNNDNVRNETASQRVQGRNNSTRPQNYDNSYRRNADNQGTTRRRETFMERRDSTFPKTNLQRFEPRDKPGNFRSTGGNFNGNGNNAFDSTRKYPPSDRNGSNQFSRNNVNLERSSSSSRRPVGRPRSRSPVDKIATGRDSFAQKFGGDSLRRGFDGYQQNEQRKKPQDSAPEPYTKVNERKFLRITGLTNKVTPDIVKDFFHPHNVVNVFLLKFTSGSYVGKLNGSALVEFTTEQIAQNALGYDGTKCGSRAVSVFRAAKDDIVLAIQESLANQPPAGALVADVNTLNALASSNPEVQHLVGLLNAAVTNIASGSNPQQSQVPPPGGRQGGVRDRNAHNPTERTGRRGNDDPVINRVASSANINVDDIKNGRVVGMRNLPYSVTPELILNLFRGYHAIEDSVRIHYLDNGRCSGDAIICFRGNREARIAVQELNKKIIKNRKVELFFL